MNRLTICNHLLKYLPFHKSFTKSNFGSHFDTSFKIFRSCMKHAQRISEPYLYVPRSLALFSFSTCQINGVIHFERIDSENELVTRSFF